MGSEMCIRDSFRIGGLIKLFFKRSKAVLLCLGPFEIFALLHEFLQRGRYFSEALYKLSIVRRESEKLFDLFGVFWNWIVFDFINV